MLRGKGGIVVMMLSVVGMVLWVTMFDNIMIAVEAIRTYTHIASFSLLSTIVVIAPTVLLLGGIFGAGWGWRKGYMMTAGTDASGILRMVFAAIVLILFVTLFSTILDAFYTLLIGGATANTDFYPSYYTAWTTVIGIAPAILFLTGTVGTIGTAVGGARAFRRRRRSRLSYA